MTGGVLDDLLAIQKQQMDVGGPGERGVSFDYAFIFDNVSVVALLRLPMLVCRARQYLTHGEVWRHKMVKQPLGIVLIASTSERSTTHRPCAGRNI